MLYPKEDRLNNTLMFSCRTCQFSEPAASSCVFRNNLYNTVGETAGVTQDVGSDPTVGEPEFFTCTLCGEELLCSTCGEASCTGFVGAVPEHYDEDSVGDMSEGVSEVFDYPDEEDHSLEGVDTYEEESTEQHTITITTSIEC